MGDSRLPESQRLLDQKEVAYKTCLKRLLSTTDVETLDSVLVLCGGELDKNVLQDMGFEKVVISNVDERLTADSEAFAPFTWSFQDAESLSFDDDSFDLVLVHHGLHHCYSPHRAILEMYRVSRKAVGILEPFDQPMVRLGVRLGFGQEYETSAVLAHDLKYGGVANTAIPNHVFRLSRREVEKTVRSFAPHLHQSVKALGLAVIPLTRLKRMKNPLPFFVARVLTPILKPLARFVPALCNNVFIWFEKPDPGSDLQPWVESDASGDGFVAQEDWYRATYQGK